MKFMRVNTVNLLAKRSKLCALFVAFFCAFILVSAPSFSATEQEQRWFEIEVILFSQLGDKTQLKEYFPDQEQQPSTLPNYRRIKDLLTPYLYPDLSTLKLQLPQCDDVSEQKNEGALANRLPPFYPLKSLMQINQSRFWQGSYSTPLNDSTFNDATVNTTVIIKNQLMPSYTTPFALLADLDLAFSPLTLTYSKLLTTPFLCKLPNTFDDQFSIKFTGTVDANEKIYSKHPYLISKNSLQLNDVLTSLKRSKNFKPLLHLGWREAPQGREQATAYRVFAGENLAFNNKKAQLAYQAQRQQTEINKAIAKAATQINEAEALELATNAKQAKEKVQEKVQEKINNILSDINHISAANEQEILAQLNDNSLPLALSPQTPGQPNSPLLQPSTPIQPWTLDGLFRVHLNHYLYITADFNLLSLTTRSQEQTTSSNDSSIMKSISFKQNRRVISGEIHYFDHPYIGMIVQIRKHERPAEPEENDPSLASGNELETMMTQQ
jgi:hypothetical protein